MYGISLTMESGKIIKVYNSLKIVIIFLWITENSVNRFLIFVELIYFVVM